MEIEKEEMKEEQERMSRANLNINYSTTNTATTTSTASGRHLYSNNHPLISSVTLAKTTNARNHNLDSFSEFEEEECMHLFKDG